MTLKEKLNRIYELVKSHPNVNFDDSLSLPEYKIELNNTDYMAIEIGFRDKEAILISNEDKCEIYELILDKIISDLEELHEKESKEQEITIKFKTLDEVPMELAIKIKDSQILEIKQKDGPELYSLYSIKGDFNVPFPRYSLGKSW